MYFTQDERNITLHHHFPALETKKDNHDQLSGAQHQSQPSTAGRPELVTVVKCQDCPTVCLDLDFLRIHKFLHLDLIYLRCSLCGFVFGTPSALKRHIFMQHEILVQPSSLKYSVLSMSGRVALTSKVQTAMASEDPDQVNGQVTNQR